MDQQLERVQIIVQMLVLLQIADHSLDQLKMMFHICCQNQLDDQMPGQSLLFFGEFLQNPLPRLIDLLEQNVDMVELQRRLICVEQRELRLGLDLEVVGESSVVQVVAERGQEDAEFLDFIEIPLEKLGLLKTVACIEEDIDRVSEVVVGVFIVIVLELEFSNQLKKVIYLYLIYLQVLVETHQGRREEKVEVFGGRIEVEILLEIGVLQKLSG